MSGQSFGPFRIEILGGMDIDGDPRTGVFLSADIPQLRGVGAMLGEEVAIVRADLVQALEQAKALPEIKALVEALNACMASLERADTEEGVCCCGDSMATHAEPINCGHVPVDMGNYYAGKALDAARAALRAIGEGGE